MDHKELQVTVGDLQRRLSSYPQDKEIIIADKEQIFMFRQPVSQEWDDGVMLYTAKIVTERDKKIAKGIIKASVTGSLNRMKDEGYFIDPWENSTSDTTIREDDSPLEWTLLGTDNLATRLTEVLEENEQLRARFDEQIRIIEEKRKIITELEKKLKENKCK